MAQPEDCWTAEGPVFDSLQKKTEAGSGAGSTLPHTVGASDICSRGKTAVK
jgi:hypothetical protein